MFLADITESHILFLKLYRRQYGIMQNNNFRLPMEVTITLPYRKSLFTQCPHRRMHLSLKFSFNMNSHFMKSTVIIQHRDKN